MRYMETLPSRKSDQNMLLRKLASSPPGRHSCPVTASVNKCKQMFVGKTLKVYLRDTKKSILNDFHPGLNINLGIIWIEAPEGPHPNSTGMCAAVYKHTHT